MSRRFFKDLSRSVYQFHPLFMPLTAYFLAWVFAVLASLFIWHLDLPIIQSTFDGSAPNTIDSQPFELFGLFATVFLVTTAWLRIAKTPLKTLRTLAPIILPTLVFLNLLSIQVETFHTRSSDYMCYENAAKAIALNINPYHGVPPCYLYPPLLAQVLVFFYHLTIHNPFFTFNSETQVWTVVTYFYQCGQFLQIVLAYYLSLFLAEKLEIKPLTASIIVAGLFLFNYPLTRDLTFDQINLWLLNSFLLSILLLNRYPFLAGLTVALGVHIKLYTLILLLPWGLTQQRKAIIGFLTGFFSIITIQTNWGQNWTLWEQFLIYFQNPEKPSNYRNEGVWSLVFNFAKIPGNLLNTDNLFNFVPITVAGLSLLIFAVFIVRFIQRERDYFRSLQNSEEISRKSQSNNFRFYGHGIDAIALSLLISPSVWEHHYVLAIPIAIWAIATHQSNQHILIYLGIFLIFCIPTFEIFPLSFHRLAGLLILIYVTSPTLTRNKQFLHSSKP